MVDSVDRHRVGHSFGTFQISSFGELTMGDVVRMMCRSMENDGHAGMLSYMESLDSEDDRKYMLGNVKLCGGPDLSGI